MADPITKAYINLNGVLHALQYLCELDSEAAAFIQKFNLSIQFSVKGGPSARLVFARGTCTFEKGRSSSDIKLWFTSFDHFNRMMDGKGMPVILKGFSKLGFLAKDFGVLTKRLEYFLRPTDEALKTPGFAEVNTLLTFYTAFNALPEIGMHDPVGMRIMQKDRKGIFCASIENTKHKVWMKMSRGLIETASGPDGSPEMHLIFADIAGTGDVLNGRCDFLTAIGSDSVKIIGYMPLMQSLELLVPRIGAYLK